MVNLSPFNHLQQNPINFSFSSVDSTNFISLIIIRLSTIMLREVIIHILVEFHADLEGYFLSL